MTGVSAPSIESEFCPAVASPKRNWRRGEGKRETGDVEEVRGQRSGSPVDQRSCSQGTEVRGRRDALRGTITGGSPAGQLPLHGGGLAFRPERGNRRRGQRSDRRSEVGGRRGEDGGPRAEDGRRRTEVRRRKAEGRKAEIEGMRFAGRTEAARCAVLNRGRLYTGSLMSAGS